MDIKPLTELDCSLLANSIDCYGSYLAVSSVSGIISVFNLSEYYESCAFSPLIPSSDIIRFYEFPCLFCGTSQGTLIVLDVCLKTSTIQIQSSYKIHQIGIQQIIHKENKVYTCGIDNYVCILQINKGFQTICLQITHSFKAHNGWVTGISLSNRYLLTLGSDNIITFWALGNYKKTMEIRYTQVEMPYSVLCRPIFKYPYFFIPYVKSEVTGEACLTIINEENLKIIQISFENLYCLGNFNGSLGKKEWMIDVQGFVELKGFIIVFAIRFIILYKEEDFELLDHFYLDEGDEILVRTI